MKYLIVPMALVMALAAAGAHAHAHLKMSEPAEGATIKQTPVAVLLTFSEPARITAASLHKDQGPKFVLKPPPAVAAAQISVAVPQLAPGRYTLNWRVVSADNHVMAGALHFTVAASVVNPMTP